ncbi:MAG: CsbD family protein [Candidatus Dormibacteraeota bacterium]|uniref:CsbD family protein n=1 Tax=Candidatus Aeolococcus gillhamiae TaxID=3127015 RepID=A0A2W5ZB23_9BACT|nr:CsbD family protein [Candidatus Dormibacteraeota bacterium]PZR80015.1 MAG: CsbD family protein [Candidatus Dormibacter sp. RRmetagenome_bin12]
MGGEADKAAGRIKEAAGDLTDDDELKGEGQSQQVAGDVKNVGDKVKDKADELGDKIKE